MNRLATEISSVNLFRRGAEVVRTGTVDLEEGMNRLEITGVSASSERNTVKLFLTEPFVCRKYRFIDRNEQLEQSRCDQLNEEITLLKKENEIREIQISLLEKNGDFTANSSATLEQISSYIDALPQKVMSLHRWSHDTNAKIRNLERQLSAVSARENGPILLVEIFAPKAGTCHIELRYQEPDAGWSMFHEIHTDASGPIDLRVRANVFQTTGEEWTDIQLTLLTGNPSMDETLPEVVPLHLDLRDNRPILRGSQVMGSMKMMAAAGRASNDMVMEMEEAAIPMERVEMPAATLQEDETMSEYVLSDPLTIASGSEGNPIDLLQYSIPADYQIASAPRNDSHAYLIAVIQTKDLPPRDIEEAKVYLKNIYTGDVSLEPDLSGDSIRLSLGRQEKVRVSTKEVKHKTSTALFSGQKTTEYAYETTITNTSDQDVRITVYDQIPVSDNKAVAVEGIGIAKEELEEMTGILTRTISIPAKKSEVLKLAYKVSWPKDKLLAEIRKPANSYPKYCPECGAPLTGPKCRSCGYRCG